MVHVDPILLNVLGKRVNRDVFSAGGALLIPKFAVITLDHLRMLAKHGILLTDDDVLMIGTHRKAKWNDQDKMIDGAVHQVRGIFEEIRETKKIPLADLSTNIVPLIHEVSDVTNLFGLFAALQSKDDYTYRHNIAVGAISSLIGKWLGLGRQDLLQLTTAAMLHDVGKIYIPKHILNKPGRLTDEEYAEMKKHTVYGYELLKETAGIHHREALPALQHHERMDGSGYPHALKQDQIEPFSRIVAVADVFHAMTSARSYRAPSPFYEVLFQMEKDTFGVLDPAITRLFIEKIMNSLIGQTVLLTDESEGTILMVKPYDPLHPLVQVGNRYIDLGKNNSLLIKKIL